MLGVGKYVAYAALAVSLLGGVAVIKRSYDNRLIAQVAAKQAAVNLATERADNARLIVALTDRATQAEAQAASIATTKEAIAHAQPSSFSCLRSAAGRIAISGMRHSAGGH